MQTDTALSLDNVYINYTITSSISLLRRKRQPKSMQIHAVNGVSFELSKGEVLGMIGENGAGKSTLLQAIAGLIETDSGTIDTKGNRVSLMSLGCGFHADLSGRENIILSGMLMGYSKSTVLERIGEIIAFSELEEFIDYPVRTYSSGMYSKLSFSIATILDTDIILVDEVLSVGDERFKQKSFRKLRKLIEDDSHTVILVSHSLDKIRLLCDRVLWLEAGTVRKIGKPKDVIPEYFEESSDTP